MTISLPSSFKIGLFGRKGKPLFGAAKSKKQLDGTQVARLFDKDVRNTKSSKPARLSETEKSDQAQMMNLRGALYADD